jgi:hypothetical protein
VRIAITGTHGVGKSTLVEGLRLRLPGHDAIKEPFYTLAEAGFAFELPPTTEQFALLVSESVRALSLKRRNVVFDRCPLDYLAYLIALSGQPAFSSETWHAGIREVISSLDLLVYLPLNTIVRSELPPAELEDLRSSADAILRRLVIDDELALSSGVQVLELDGRLDDRVERILAHLGAS